MVDNYSLEGSGTSSRKWIWLVVIAIVVIAVGVILTFVFMKQGTNGGTDGANINSGSSGNVQTAGNEGANVNSVGGGTGGSSGNLNGVSGGSSGTIMSSEEAQAAVSAVVQNSNNLSDSEKDGALYGLAVNSLNSSVCNLIKDESSKFMCNIAVYAIWGDDSYCRNLNISGTISFSGSSGELRMSFKDYCWNYFAKAKWDTSYCNNISDSAAKEACLNE